MAEAQNPNPQDTPQGQFAIQKIYTKDVSFETPNSPAIFSKNWQPQADVRLETATKLVGEHIHEVTLTVTVTVKLEDKTAFLVEVQQAGLFAIKGLPDPQLSQVLGALCPNILFPYAREAISDLVTRGGFPQLLLAPVNFDLLYAQRMQQQGQADGGQPTTLQ
jgi:preprotein translocase subunit SecB